MSYITVDNINKGGFRRKWENGNNSVDPYITGHMVTDWIAPTSGIAGNAGEVSAVLSQTCLSVTLPGGTVNRAEFQGLGNQRFSVPGSVEWDNTITCRFLEFSGCPILNIFHSWVTAIRDYSVGIAGPALRKENYGKAAYCGIFYYATFDAGGRLEDYECASGVFPLKDPRDLYGHDITAIDKLEVDIDFNVDTLWHDVFVKTYCGALLKQIRNMSYAGNGLENS